MNITKSVVKTNDRYFSPFPALWGLNTWIIEDVVNSEHIAGIILAGLDWEPDLGPSVTGVSFWLELRCLCPCLWYAALYTIHHTILLHPSFAIYPAHNTVTVTMSSLYTCFTSRPREAAVNKTTLSFSDSWNQSSICQQHCFQFCWNHKVTRQTQIITWLITIRN